MSIANVVARIEDNNIYKYTRSLKIGNVYTPIRDIPSKGYEELIDSYKPVVIRRTSQLNGNKKLDITDVLNRLSSAIGSIEMHLKLHRNDIIVYIIYISNRNAIKKLHMAIRRSALSAIASDPRFLFGISLSIGLFENVSIDSLFSDLIKPTIKALKDQGLDMQRFLVPLPYPTEPHIEDKLIKLSKLYGENLEEVGGIVVDFRRNKILTYQRKNYLYELFRIREELEEKFQHPLIMYGGNALPNLNKTETVQLAQNFILSILGVDIIGDIPWGRGGDNERKKEIQEAKEITTSGKIISLGEYKYYKYKRETIDTIISKIKDDIPQGVKPLKSLDMVREDPSNIPIFNRERELYETQRISLSIRKKKIAEHVKSKGIKIP